MMPEPKVLFITHIDPNWTASGSSVRPVMLLRAFRELNCEVQALYGPSNRFPSRVKTLWNTLRWLKTNRPDFCYVEPPAGPMFCFGDHLLLFQLKRMKIPLAVFIRDAFWKVPETWGAATPKRLILELMSRFDWMVYNRTVNTFYFPSRRMADLFPTRCKKMILPPGGVLLAGPLQPPAGTDRLSLIYVGAIADRYGSEILFQAFRLVLAANSKIDLHIVCRRDEWDRLDSSSKDLDHMLVHHIQGAELGELYRLCDIALVPIRKSSYMDFAIPVKLYEYISYHLPVVVTDCAEMAEFVSRQDIGLVTASEAAAFAAGILNLAGDQALRAHYRARAAETLLTGHLWTDRARQILNDMGKA